MLFHLLNEKDIRLLLQKFCPSIQKRGCEKAVLHQVIRTTKIVLPIFRLVVHIIADASF